MNPETFPGKINSLSHKAKAKRGHMDTCLVQLLYFVATDATVMAPQGELKLEKVDFAESPKIDMLIFFFLSSLFFFFVSFLLFINLGN